MTMNVKSPTATCARKRITDRQRRIPSGSDFHVVQALWADAELLHVGEENKPISDNFRVNVPLEVPQAADRRLQTVVHEASAGQHAQRPLDDAFDPPVHVSGKDSA